MRSVRSVRQAGVWRAVVCSLGKPVTVATTLPYGCSVKYAE